MTGGGNHRLKIVAQRRTSQYPIVRRFPYPTELTRAEIQDGTNGKTQLFEAIESICRLNMGARGETRCGRRLKFFQTARLNPVIVG
jgi:hypothetical protein